VVKHSWPKAFRTLAPYLVIPGLLFAVSLGYTVTEYLLPPRFDLAIENLSGATVNVHLVTPFPGWDQAWYQVPSHATRIIRNASRDPDDLDRLVLYGADCQSLGKPEVHPSDVATSGGLIIDVDGTVEFGDVAAGDGSGAAASPNCGP
jgi:hypothetical protein